MVASVRASGCSARIPRPTNVVRAPALEAALRKTPLRIRFDYLQVHGL